MTANRQDIAVGALFVSIGLLFGWDVFRTDLPVGTLMRMDAGYFPLILAVVLIVLGVAIGVRAMMQRVEAPPARPIPWRAIAVLTPLPIFFGLTIIGLGLVTPVFVVAFGATFADRNAKIRSSLVTAAGITVFCVVVFYFLADIPIRLFGPWFDFLRG
jgi:hypothetical protein